MADTSNVSIHELRAPVINPDIEALKTMTSGDYRLTSAKKVKFTKDFATSFLEMPAFVAERPLRDGHVEELIKAAKRGDFHAELVQLASAHCRYDKTYRRLNGQHTCWMRQYMPDDWEITVSCLVYEVDSEDEFRRLYSTFDRGAARTSAHIINARLLGTEEFSEFTKHDLGLIVKGYAAFKMQTGKVGNPDTLADAMTGEGLKLCKLVQRVINATQVHHTGVGAHLRRAGIIGAMFVTCQKNFEQSLIFWQKVADGLGATSKDDPPFKLRDYIIKSPKGRETAGKEAVITKEDLLRLCIVAWNNWRKGEPMKQIRFHETRPAAR